MKILVVGASKGIGRQTVKAALEQGHNVTAFSRNPTSLDIRHPHLKLHPGNVLDASSVKQAVSNHDVVICTLGLPTLKAIGPPFSKRSYVLSTGTKNILEAMSKKGVKRFLCITAIGTGDSARECSLVARLTLRYGLHWLFQEKDRQEKLIRSHQDLLWTIIRPTALTKGRKRGALVGERLHSGILTHVSRVDVAVTMLEVIDQENSYHKALTISYPERFGDSIRWVAGYFGLG